MLHKLLFIMVLLLLVVVPTIAQDVPPQLDPGGLYSWSDFVQEPAAVWVAMIAAMGAIGSIVTALYKVIVARFWPGGLDYVNLVAFLAPIVLTGLYFTVDTFGFADTFVGAANLIVVLVPVILTFFGVSVTQGASYKLTKRAGASYLGETSSELKARLSPVA